MARRIINNIEHLRKINFANFAREGPVFFQRSRCVFSGVSQVPGEFFKFMKNQDFSPRMGPNKIDHKPNPLTAPYSAHIL